MSTADDDMEKPITKRELREIISNDLVTKHEMHDLMSKLFAYLDAMEMRLAASMRDMANVLREEFRAGLSAVSKRHLDEIAHFNEGYIDLRPRIAKLEAAVFPEPPAEPRAKRQRRR
jgi:hypothetical protein